MTKSCVFSVDSKNKTVTASFRYWRTTGTYKYKDSAELKLLKRKLLRTLEHDIAVQLGVTI